MRVMHRHGQRVAGVGCACHQWVVPQSSSKLAEWDALVATAAKNAMRGRLPFDGPVRVELTFLLERPKSHTKAQRAVPWASGKPDVDKLTRAVFDTFSTAAVWTDDARAVDVRAVKRYPDGFEQAGVIVRIEALA
jgi:Holliday junction resolvase RusA-like endonuclease